MVRFEIFLFIELTTRLNKGQEVRMFWSLHFGELFLQFHALLFLDLLHGLQKELFDV